MDQKYSLDMGIFVQRNKEEIAKTLLAKMLERDGYQVRVFVMPDDVRDREVISQFYDLAKNKCNYLMLIASAGFETNVLALQTIKIGIQKSRRDGNYKTILVETRKNADRWEMPEVFLLFADQNSSSDIAMKVDELLSSQIKIEKTESERNIQIVVAERIENSKFF